jgi:hypothetical protein
MEKVTLFSMEKKLALGTAPEYTLTNLNVI